MRNSVVFGVTAASFSGLVAACGGDDDSAAPAEPSEAQPEPTPEPAPEPEPAPAGLDATAVINLGLEADVDSLDPQAFKTLSGYLLSAHLGDSLGYHEATKEGDLLIADPETFGPLIATDRQISDDFSEYTFTLRDDATWSDGTPVTVEDVKYTFDRGFTGVQYVIAVADLLRAQGADTTQIVDDRTVKFVFQGPSPLSRFMLGMPVFAIQQKAAGDANATEEEPGADSFWRQNVVPNGAYTFSNWQRGQGFTLTPNPNYYYPELAQNNGGIEAKIITDPQQRISLLRSGDLHIVTGVAPKDAVALADDPESGAKILNAPSPWSVSLMFNNEVEPLSNKQVRQALSYAVPYEQIINDVMFGLAKPAQSMVPQGMPTHDPSTWPYATDLQKAKELLTAAGFPDGFNSKIAVLLGRGQDEDAAVFIQSNFREIGVNVEIDKLQPTDYQGSRTEKSYEMMIAEWLSWVNDPMYHMFWNLTSPAVFTNNVGYLNEDFDALVAGNIYEIDAAKRETASKEAQAIAIDDAPMAWLYAQDFYFPVSERLTNLYFGPDQNLRLQYSSLAAV